jgi:chromosome partitioning protein
VRCLAVTNQKGGVAKTTSVRNLAVALVQLGQRVLVVDLDPQANLTTGSGIDLHTLRHSVYDVLVNKRPIVEAISQTREGYDIAVSDEALMRAEMEMGDKHLGWVRELKKALDPVRGTYDFCLFDTPPIRGFLTVNALVAADHGVIIPCAPERDAIMGMQLLLARMDELLPANPTLQVVAVVPCMVDRHWRVHVDTLEELRRRFPTLFFADPIMRHADFPKASQLRMSMLEYAPNSGGAKSYRALAALVLKRTQTVAVA